MGGGDADFHAAISRDNIRQAIGTHLNRTDFELSSYNLKPASDKPMGFLGVHIKIQAEIKLDNNIKHLYYFAKKIPTDVPSHHEYALSTGAFSKEIQMYATVIKDYQSALSRPSRKWSSDFYYARDSEIFIIEDLSAEGFFVIPERTLIPLNYVIEAVKSMAVMHGAAICFEEKLKLGLLTTLSQHYKPGGAVTMDVLYPNLMYESEASDDPKHMGYTFYEAGIKSQSHIVDLLDGYTDEQRNQIKQKLPDILRTMLKLVKKSDKYRNVLIHGDLWSNNMMFRCDSKDNVTDVVFIDFQLARFAPPAHDLRMFLHLVQTKEFREKHERHILDVYYNTMTMELKNEGISIEDVYPRKELEDSYCDLYEYGLLTQVLYYQLILLPPNISSKFLSSPDLFDLNFLVDRSAMVVETFRTDELCRTRMTEAMNELIQHYKLA